MTLNDAYIILLGWMISQAKNKKYISDLKYMQGRIEDKKTIEEQDSPKYQAIQMGYHNLFPFSDKIIFLMAQEIIEEKKNVQHTENST